MQLSGISGQLTQITNGLNTVNRSIALGINGITSSINEQQNICKRILSNQESSYAGISSNLNDLKELEKIQIEQDKRYYDYQNYVTQLKRFEDGHLSI